jgi:hypothetical protein
MIGAKYLQTWRFTLPGGDAIGMAT